LLRVPKPKKIIPTPFMIYIEFSHPIVPTSYSIVFLKEAVYLKPVNKKREGNGQ
jgi:hypothetical protein